MTERTDPGEGGEEEGRDALERCMEWLLHELRSGAPAPDRVRRDECLRVLSGAFQKTAQAMLRGCAAASPVHDAEDAAQEWVIALWTGWSRIATDRDPYPYLLSTLRNICIRLARKGRSWRQAPAFWDEADARSDPAQEFSRDCAAKDLWECAVQLPPAQRQAIEACCFQQLSPAEAAAALGRPTSSIYVALHRARQRLNEKLQARGHEAWEFGGRSSEQRENLSDPRKKSGAPRQ